MTKKKKPPFDLNDFIRRAYRRLVRCPRGLHSRSLEHVRPESDRYVSQCEGCGARMVRLSKRNWIVDAPARR